MGKRLNWRPWLRNVITTVVSGGAHGLIAGLTTMGVAPDTFNLSQGLHKTLAVAFICAGFSGLISLANLLSDPAKAIPEDVDDAQIVDHTTHLITPPPPSTPAAVPKSDSAAGGQ